MSAVQLDRVGPGDEARFDALLERLRQYSLCVDGVLRLAEDRHGLGLGRQAFACVRGFACEGLGATRLRLAAVDSNPVVGFWTRMGCALTGESKPDEGECVRFTSRLMECPLK